MRPVGRLHRMAEGHNQFGVHLQSVTLQPCSIYNHPSMSGKLHLGRRNSSSRHPSRGDSGGPSEPCATGWKGRPLQGQHTSRHVSNLNRAHVCGTCCCHESSVMSHLSEPSPRPPTHTHPIPDTQTQCPTQGHPCVVEHDLNTISTRPGIRPNTAISYEARA